MTDRHRPRVRSHRTGRAATLLIAALAVAVSASGAWAQEVAVEVFKKLAPSTVKFVSAEGDGIGTGFVIHPDGIILTNAHVVASPMVYHIEVEYRNAAGERAVATFKKVDANWKRHPEYDLAIVRIDPSENETIPLIPVEFYDDEVLPGMASFAIGHPRGGAKSISVGNISSVDYVDQADPDGVPHTMSTSIVQGGNSGGPVVDSQGRVLGVATFFLTDPRGGSALTGCVPRKVWRDFSVFTGWEHAKGNKEAAKRYEEIADRILDQVKEMTEVVGSQDPRVEQGTAMATQLYARALAEDRNEPRLLLKMARMLIEFEQPAKAANYLVEAIDAKPWDHPDAYGLLGLALLGVDDSGEDALIAAEEGVAKFPRNSVAWVARGRYFGDRKDDWNTAVLYGNIGWDLSEKTTHLSKKLVSKMYFDAKQKLAEAGQREPQRAEVDALIEEEVEARVDDAEKLKAKGERFTSEPFAALIKKYKPDAPPPPAKDMDLNKMMADLKAGITTTPNATPPAVATPAPSQPTPTPTPPKPAVDKDAEWIKGKMGLAQMYYDQRQTRPDLKDKALQVLKQIDYRYPEDPRADRARELFKLWGGE